MKTFFVSLMTVLAITFFAVAVMAAINGEIGTVMFTILMGGVTGALAIIIHDEIN